MQPVELRWTKLWWSIGWAMVALVVYLSVGHVSVTPPVEGGDKLGHAMAYATLALWFMQLKSEQATRVMVALGLAAMGVGLEFVQAGLPYRQFDTGDMLANGAGVVAGWLIAPPRTPNVLKIAEGMM